MNNIDKYKNDSVAYAEEVLGFKLYGFQKEMLRTIYEGLYEGKLFYVQYSKLHGKRMTMDAMKQYSNKFRELP